MELPRLSKVAFALILAGAGLAWIGLRYGGPSTWGSVAVFGLVAVLGGADSVITRRHRTAQGHLRSEIVHRHTGLGAVLLGAAMLLPGLIMVGVGLSGILGFTDGLGVWASARLGPITMAVGSWAALGGCGLLISRWSYEDQPTHWWQRLPGQLVGLLVVLMGVGLIVASRALAVHPDDPRAVLGLVAKWIARVLGGPGSG